MANVARVIGVVDISAGLAVHARGGARAHYGPIQAVAGRAIPPGDALALARWYVDTMGVGELYVADLDALRGRAPQRLLVESLCGLGVPVWLDAATASVDEARQALTAGVGRVVVGLETLPSVDALEQICRAIGAPRAVFSLDLRRGEPVVAAASPHGRMTAEALAAAAARAGVGAMIVLDIARVGTRKGIDIALLSRLRAVAPAVELVVGGGIRGASDLAAAGRVGCDAALVATALLDGRLSAGDIAAARRACDRAVPAPEG